MMRIAFSWLWLTAALTSSCYHAVSADQGTADADADADGDADGDSDSDADSDADGDTDITVSLEPGFEHGLTNKGGCGDVLIYAAREDQRVALFFRAEGPISETPAGGCSENHLSLSHSGSVEVLLGESLLGLTCTDMVESEPIVARTYRATKGTGLLILCAVEGSEMFHANLALTNVVLTPEDNGEEVVLESLEFYDIQVGWYAG